MIPALGEKNKRLLEDFLWRAAQLVGKQGVTFLIFLMAATLLTPYEFGMYNYLLALVFLLVIFADFGISTAASTYAAGYNATDPRKLSRLLFNSVLVILSASGIVFAVIALTGRFYLGERYVYLMHLSPALVLIPLTSLYDGMYRGLRRFRQLSVITMAVGVFSMPIVYVFVRMWGLVGALHAQNVFYLVLAAALMIGHGRFEAKFDFRILWTVARYAVFIGVANVSFFLYTKMDVIILQHFNYVVEIGYYEMAMRIFNILMLPCLVLGQILAPGITAMFAKGEFRDIRRQARRWGGLLLVYSAVLSVAGYWGVRFALKAFLPQYCTEAMLQTLFLLAFLLPFKNWGTVLTQAFVVPGGYARSLSVITLLGGVLNIASDLILILRMGYIGVIWSTLIVHPVCILLVNISFAVLVRQSARKSTKGRAHADSSLVEEIA